MILPTKHLNQDRALLTVGARILPRLDHPKTVSALWEELSCESETSTRPRALRYDAFVLTLDLLFLLGTIHLHEGRLARTTS